MMLILTELFALQCLPYLDSSLASQLLLDVIEHCIEEPMTSGDYLIIDSIRERVIEKLLCVPYEIDSLLEKQLKPLSRTDKYIPLSRDDPDEFDVLSAHERSKVSETVDSIQKEEIENEESVKISDVVQDCNQSEVSTEQAADSNQNTETEAKIDTCTDKEIESNEKVIHDNRTNENKPFGKSDLTYDRQFWNKFLWENATILETLLLFTEKHVKNIETDTDPLHFLAQLGLLGLIKINESLRSIPVAETLFPLGQNNEIPFRWLIYNLVLKNCQENGRTTSLPEVNPAYIVDQSIADELSKQTSVENWVTCVHTVLKTTINRFQSDKPGSEEKVMDINFTNDIADHLSQTVSDHSNNNKSSYSIDNIESNAHIVSGLCLHKDVLCRMIEGCLTDIENNASSDEDLPLNDCQVILRQLQNTKAAYKAVDAEPDSDKVEPEEQVEFGKYQADSLESRVRNSADLGALSSESEEKTLMFGDSWKSDVSLEALCWRIRYRLPYCQGEKVDKNMSCIMRKPAFFICQNKGADQPLAIFGLCWTWSETTKTGFLMTQLI